MEKTISQLEQDRIEREEELERLLGNREQENRALDEERARVYNEVTPIEQNEGLAKGIIAAGRGFNELIGAPVSGYDAATKNIADAASAAKNRRSSLLDEIERRRKISERPLNDIKERLTGKKTIAEESLLPGQTRNQEIQQAVNQRKLQTEQALQEPTSKEAQTLYTANMQRLSQIAGNPESANRDIAGALMSSEGFQQLPPSMQEAEVAKLLKAEGEGKKYEFKTFSEGDATGYAVFDPKTGQIVQRYSDKKTIREPTGRSGDLIQADLLRKDYEKETQEVRSIMGDIKNTRNMFEVAKKNPEAVGVLQYNIARSIAGEKGPLSNQDVQRAGLGSVQVFDQLLQVASSRGLGALTQGQQRALESLLQLAEKRQNDKMVGIRGRYEVRANKVGADMEYITGEKQGQLVTPPALSPQDQQALEWARKNPNDPRAKAIVEKINKKQGVAP